MVSENNHLRQISALFVREDSVYASLPGVDCWPASRDARKWPGGTPVIVHPPCRAWGRMRHLAKPVHGEKEMARFAVRMVRKWGGVLEHPESSALWEDMKLPGPRECDKFGGWTLSADQYWWGHEAQKRTWFYLSASDSASSNCLSSSATRQRSSGARGAAGTGSGASAARKSRKRIVRRRRRRWRHGLSMQPGA